MQNKFIKTLILFLLLVSGFSCTDIKTTKNMRKYFEDNIYYDLEQTILSGKANLNYVYKDGSSILSLVCYSNHKESYDILRLLLKKGAKRDFSNEKRARHFILAIMHSKKYCVRAILEKKILMSKKNLSKALVSAAAKGYEDICKKLIEYGAKVNYYGNYDDSPLISACYYGHLKIVKLLIKNGAKVNTIVENKNIALNVASSKGYFEIAKLLIKNKADYTLKDKNNKSALDIALTKGHDKIVALFLDKADINHYSTNGKTALSIACETGKLPLVRALLQKGVKRDFMHDNRALAFIKAIDEGKKEIIQEILKEKISMSSDNLYQSLCAAASMGYYQICEKLLEYGALLKQNKITMETPLINAAENKHTQLVRFFLEKGADVNQANSNGETPLNATCASGNLETLNLLLKAHANLDFSSDTAIEKLIRGISIGNKVVIQRILKEKIKISKLNLSKVLFEACKKGYVEISKILIKKGANVNYAEDYKNTPIIIYAVKNNHPKIVKLLLKNGANVNKSNRDDKTALAEACLNGNLNIVKLLLKNGAKREFMDEVPALLFIKGISIPKNEKIYEEILKRKVKMYKQDLDKALTEACKNGYYTVSKKLIKYGANVNSKQNPLYWASKTGHLKIAKLLLRKGAKVKFFKTFHRLPLFAAAKNGHLKIVKLLIENGANPNQPEIANLYDRSYYPYSVYSLACKTANIKLLKLLLKSGKKIKMHSYISSALVSAISSNNILFVKLILKNLYNCSKALNSGPRTEYTYLWHARNSNHKEMEQLLKSYGAKEESEIQPYNKENTNEENEEEDDGDY